MRDKISAMASEFNLYFKERSEEVNCSLLSVLSGEHILFLGPPGTAKSLLAKNICGAVEGGHFYTYLLTRFTTPEEIFGPLSLKSLQQDEYKRKIDGYLPTANIAFLDEIFKSNSSILNSLLTLLNERKYHNGQVLLDVPLLSAFGASNELPEEDESLQALYDRFLFRCVLDYVQDDSNFNDLVFSSNKEFTSSTRLSLIDIKEVQDRSLLVEFDDELKAAITSLRKDLRQRDIHISDRRWKKIANVLRIAAAGIDNNRVDRTMLLLLKHMIWDYPEQKEPIRDILINLVIAGGINLEKLNIDVKDLLSLVEHEKVIVLPDVVTCSDCGSTFETFEELAEHAMVNHYHNYEDPYNNTSPFSSHSRVESFYDICDSLQKHLQLSESQKQKITDAIAGYKSYNDNQNRPRFVNVMLGSGARSSTATDGSGAAQKSKTDKASKQKELYTKEFIELKTKYNLLRQKMEDDKESLKRSLSDNIWISSLDKTEVLRRYEDHTKVRIEIENRLKSIEVMLQD